MEIKYSKFNRALALVDAMLQTFVVSPDDAVVSVGADELEVDVSTEDFALTVVVRPLEDGGKEEV